MILRGLLAASATAVWMTAAVAAEPGESGRMPLGVSLVKKINPPGEADFDPEAAIYQNELYFGATAGPGEGTDLYKVRRDGAAVRVADIDPNNIGYLCCEFAEYRNELYFPADGGPDIGVELFKLNRYGRVILVKDMLAGDSSYPHSLFNYNGLLLFAAEENRLYMVNKLAKVVPVKDAQNRDVFLNSAFKLFKDDLYFSGYRPDTGDAKIYKMTREGEVLLVQDPGDATSFPEGFTEFRGELYFAGYRPDVEYGLFKLTAGGDVVLVADVDAQNEMLEFEAELYFAARYEGEVQLLKLRRDGTVVLAGNITPSRKLKFTVYRGELYIGGFKLDADYGLYKVRRDGILTLVSSRWDPESSFPLTEYRGELYFPAGELLKVQKNGRVAAVAAVNPWELLTTYRGQLYFWAFDADGAELYKLGPAEN